MAKTTTNPNMKAPNEVTLTTDQSGKHDTTDSKV